MHIVFVRKLIVLLLYKNLKVRFKPAGFADLTLLVMESSSVLEAKVRPRYKQVISRQDSFIFVQGTISIIDV